MAVRTNQEVNSETFYIVCIRENKKRINIQVR